MSTFNKPYKTDEELVMQTLDEKRKSQLRKRKMANGSAKQIFDGVIDAVNGGKISFTKEEMIRCAPDVGMRALDTQDWAYWSKAWNEAMNRIRSYYWGNKNTNPTDRRMFNFVRNDRQVHGGKSDGKYYLVPTTNELLTNVIYESYDRKMRGIQQKQEKIAASAYRNILTLDQKERKELLIKLREDHLLNGD